MPAEKVVIIPTGSLRKRELIKMFLVLANGGELPAYYYGATALEMIKRFKLLHPQNCNGATAEDEELDTWNGVSFFAVENGGEKNLPGLTIQQEAFNKAEHALLTSQLLLEFIKDGIQVIVFAADGQDLYLRENNKGKVSKGKFRADRKNNQLNPTWEELQTYLGDVGDIDVIMSQVGVAILNANQLEQNEEEFIFSVEFGFQVAHLLSKIEKAFEDGELDYQASWLGLLQLVMDEKSWIVMAEAFRTYFTRNELIPDFLKDLSETEINFIMMCQILGVPLWTLFEYLEEFARSELENSVD